MTEQELNYEMPERIYLQSHGDPDEWEGITWCVDEINDDDVEYVKMSVINAAVDSLMESQKSGLWRLTDDDALSFAIATLRSHGLIPEKETDE